MGHFSQDDLNKLEDREPTGGGRASEWFRPSHDKNTGEKRNYTVRLLPLAEDDPYPFYYERMHYFYGENYLSGACPQVVDEHCPACDIFFKLWNVPELSGDANKALRSSLQKLGPDQRAFANVYDPVVERIRAWSIPYGARKKLETKIDNRKEQGILVTDPEDGYDMVITMVKLGRNSKVDDVDVAPSPSAVPIEDWSNNLKDLAECARQRQLDADKLAEVIPEQLGDHYEKLMELYEQYNDTDEELGEEV